MTRQCNFSLRAFITATVSTAALMQPVAAHAQDAAQGEVWSQGFGAAEPSGDAPQRGEVRIAQLSIQPTTDRPTPASAQASSQSPSSAEQGVFVGSIVVTSDGELTTQNFASIVEQNIGQELAQESLSQITQQIADAARDKGYVFATTRIPEQAVRLGVLQVELQEGRIDDVRINGSDNKALREILEPLKGTIAVKQDVERTLLLAGDLPKIRVQRTRFLTENGRNILEVTVSERKNRLRVSADNYGTRSLGPARARLSFDYSGLLTGSDAGSVSVRSNPTDPGEFVFVNANYSVGVGNNGTRAGVSASAGRTDAGDFGNGNAEGDSRFVQIFASHPLRRSVNGSLWLNGSIAYLTIEQDDALGLLQQDNQVTFSLGLASNNKLLAGRLRIGATLSQGLDIFDATREGSFLSSRFDGDGVFTKGYFYANWSGKVSGDLGLYLGVEGQIANRPLLAAQEFSIGGAYSVRGFDFSDASGDNGFSALAELNYSFRNPAKWIDRLTPYIFLDGGYADNLRDGFGDGTLISTGLGLRGNIGKFNFEVEGAVPLNTERFESGDRSPHVNARVGLDI